MLSDMFNLNVDVMVNVTGKLVKFSNASPSHQTEYTTKWYNYFFFVNKSFVY
jgi:hypothetical protein